MGLFFSLDHLYTRDQQNISPFVGFALGSRVGFGVVLLFLGTK